MDDIYYRPRMPYTIGLLGAVPRLDSTRRETAGGPGGQPALGGAAAPGLSIRPPLPDVDRSLHRRRATRLRSPTTPGTPPPASTGTGSAADDLDYHDIFPVPAPPTSPLEQDAARAAGDRARAAPDETALSPDEGGGPPPPGRHRLRGRRDRPRHRRGRDPRPGRRVRLRQEHHAAGDPRPQASDRRRRGGVRARRRAPCDRAGSARASAATCRSSSRTRWPRSTRG